MLVEVLEDLTFLPPLQQMEVVEQEGFMLKAPMEHPILEAVVVVDLLNQLILLLDQTVVAV